VPFTDDPEQQKHRPVVIIGWSTQDPRTDDRVVLVVPITSFGEVPAPRRGDIEIPNWQACGLEKRSWVRARRLWGASPEAIDRRKGCTGNLWPETLVDVISEFSQLFAG